MHVVSGTRRPLIGEGTAGILYTRHIRARRCSGGTWSEQAKLLPNDIAASDNVGYRVAIEGDTALVSARGDSDNGANSGSVYVFVRSGTTWTQQAKLQPSDGAASDFFGQYVAISGDTALITAHKDDDTAVDSGSAYIFTRSGTTWSQQAKLHASDPGLMDSFGQGGDIDGDTVAIGAYWDDIGGNGDQGSVYVFTRSGTTWTEQQKITASDGAGNDQFGHSVSISGDTLVVGSLLGNSSSTADVGAAYVYTRTSGSWSQQAKLNASDAASNDQFGFAVYLVGNTCLVGSIFDDDGGTDSGSASLFTRNGTAWTERQKWIASDDAAGDRFGVAVAHNAGTGIVGGYRNDDGGIDSGSVYIFEFDDTAPTVNAITPGTAGPTNADSVSFTVTFSEAVQNFNNASDVAITHGGTASSGVTITGGPTTYTVTVNNITGDGSFILAVNTASDVQDLAGNALASSITSTSVNIDNTGFTVSGNYSNVNSPTNADSIPFTVEFNTPVSNFNDANDLTVQAIGTSYSGVQITGGPSDYTVTFQDVTGDGTLDFRINGLSDVQDSAGNGMFSNLNSNTVTVDNTPASFHNITVTPSEGVAGDVVSISFTSSEDLSQDPVVLVNGHSASPAAKAGPFNYEYVIAQSDPPGLAEINISGTDIAGNEGQATNGVALNVLVPESPLPVAWWPAALGVALAASALLRPKWHARRKCLPR